MFDLRRLFARSPARVQQNAASVTVEAPFDRLASYRRYDALVAEGRLAEAAAEMERLVVQLPDDPIAHHRIGWYRHQTSGLEAALAHYRRAAACSAVELGELLAKGASARVAGLAAVAEEALRAALVIDPDHPHAVAHLAVLCFDHERFDEAADLFERLKVDATQAEPRAQLLCALSLAGRTAAVAERLREWVGQGIVDAAGLLQLAGRLDQHGETVTARLCCEAAGAHRDHPELRIFSDMLLPNVLPGGGAVESELADHRRRLDALASSGLRVSPPPPWLGRTARIRHFFCARHDRAHGEAIQRACLAVAPELAWTAPHCEQWRARKLPARLRIGFLAPAWFPMLWGLAQNLDRSRFEPVFVDCSDGALPALPEWRASVDRTIELGGRSLFEAREMLAREALDIIVSTPHVPIAYQLGYARLAPVQCSLAEPAWTDGVPTLDHYISWARAEPADPDRAYVSATALLERPPYWLERDHCRPAAVGRGDFGLPAGARWYVCPQALQKIHPDFDAAIGEILRRDPGGIVVLLHGEWAQAQQYRRRLRKAFGDLAARVHMLPTLAPERCHGLLLLADALLDSWPIGGMWSAYTAALLAVPAVTLPSDIPFGRWMAALYEWLGVTDVIARDPADYVRLALRLAHEPEWRRGIAARLAARREILVEDRQAVRELEGFLQAAVAAAHRGETPRPWRGGGFVAAGAAQPPS